jgi:hypothetical protein
VLLKDDYSVQRVSLDWSLPAAARTFLALNHQQLAIVLERRGEDI